MLFTRSVRIVALAAAAALGGCASSSHCRSGGSAVDSAAAPADLPVVTLTAESAPGFGSAAAPEDYARRDAALNPRPVLTALEQSAWQPAFRPTLERDRTTTLSSSPGRFTYYQTERRRLRWYRY